VGSNESRDSRTSKR